MNSGPGKCATTAVSELEKSYCYGTRGKILESNDIQSSIPCIFFLIMKSTNVLIIVIIM